MSAIQGTPSVQILKNRGVPVLVHAVEPDIDGVRWNRVYDANDAPVHETDFVRFTALSLSDIEDRWGGNDGWEKALEEKPYTTLIDTFAIMWECSRQKAGKRLIDDAVDDYSTAVGAAFMQANGIEGDAVVRVIASGVKSARQLRERLSAEGAKVVQEMEKQEAEAEAQRAADDAPANAIPTSLPSLTSGEDDSAYGSSKDSVLTSSGT